MLPNAIVGDLDSIDPYVREHFERLNVEIIKESEQYSTDFAKCLRYLKNNFENIISSSPEFSADYENVPRKQQRHLDIVILGGLGGRVDQAFSQIHSLYTASQSTADKPPGDLYLISEESISFLLCEGRNTILTPGGGALESRKKFPSGLEFTECCFSENVGIIPVGGTSVINTKGFEWDVRDWETKFGGQLSTSNHIRADAVEVNTTIPVLFTMELADWLKYTECSVFAESHQ
ncbi:thiamine pyrophosphokinase [Ophidiomyces ophidiicola]|nr:thiamine pyrophosphokinase [Ophidiomyces ophidiicola]KAI1957492.1 thiamine pyrophosphokinase [Ophidiomyces ophidiicola]